MCIKTLKDIYDAAINDRGSWDYYENIDNESPHFQLADMDNSKKCRSFIIKYLHHGQKDSNFFLDEIDALSDDRCKHIVSTLFWGTIMYNSCNKVKSNIDNIVKNLKFRSDEVPSRKFSYLWFLMALFHDLGYAVEDGNVEYEFDVIIKKAKEIILDQPNTTNFKDSDLDKKICACLENSNFSSNDGYSSDLASISSMLHSVCEEFHCSIPNRYNESSVMRYAEYRKCFFGKKDHGVYGGMTFFMELYGLLIKRQSDGYSDLYFDKDLIIPFGYAAWIIICHNIFYINANTIPPCYRCKKLDDFVIGDKYPINSFEHSILFLFCLADSIDPFKMFGGIKSYKQIDCTLDKETITFNVSKLKCADRLHFLQKMSSLNNWLTKTEIKEEDYTATVYLNNSEYPPQICLSSSYL